MDLAGKRIAVIGNAASAVQFVPQVAPLASRLTIFQRSANWLMPRKDRLYAPRTQRLLTRFPRLAKAYHDFQWFFFGEMQLTPLMKQVRWVQWLARHKSLAHLRRQVKDPSLRAKLTPVVFTQEQAGGRTWNTLKTAMLPVGVTWTYDRGYLVAASDALASLLESRPCVSADDLTALGLFACGGYAGFHLFAQWPALRGRDAWVEQMLRLRSEFGVYGVDSGRICVAAINSRNIERVVAAIAASASAPRASSCASPGPWCAAAPAHRAPRSATAPTSPGRPPPAPAPTSTATA